MLLAIGRIGRAHGIRGEVSVEIRTDDPGARFAAGSSLATDPETVGPLTIETVREHSGRLLVRFEGFADRTAAETLTGTTLLIDSADVPPTDDPDEFNDHELIGLTVVLTDGIEVGEVADVEHHGQDLLVVRAKDGTDALVPFVAAIVVEVDVNAGRLVLDPPQGLLD
jgi:16S rRNA processing protein RimM